MANKKKTPTVPDFEGTLKRLEHIVTQMEGSELTLEQALQHFETGITLTRECQQALEAAEQRVQYLMMQEELSVPAPSALSEETER